MILFFGLSGMTFALTQIYQFVLGYSPLEAGVRALPQAIAVTIAAPLGTRLAGRFGTKAVVTTGLLMMAAGLAAVSTANGHSTYLHYMVGGVIMAAGIGLTMAPATDAIMASCAIPGVFPPVRLGGQLLVDGGVVSSTNLDVATAAGCTFIVAVAPMAFDPTVESPVTRLIRRSPGRAVAREGEEAVRAGVETLLIRPTAAQLAEQGPNLMRADGLDAVARIAYDMTAPILEGGLAADLLANAGAASGPRDRVEVRARPLDGPAAVSLTSS